MGRGPTRRAPSEVCSDGGPPERSPGPCYYPSLKTMGTGPGGKGPAYTMGSSHRVPLEKKCTTMPAGGISPGPKYMAPQSVGRQTESTKRSYNAGNFSRSERVTLALPDRDSPGPATYLPLVRKTGAPLSLLKAKGSMRSTLTGMGTDSRFAEARVNDSPGPIYKVPTSVGGRCPDIKSFPVVSFSRGKRELKSGVKGCSPGPVYTHVPAVGPQVSSTLQSPPRFGFGTGSRFHDTTAEENVSHRAAMRRARGLKAGAGEGREERQTVRFSEARQKEAARKANRWYSDE